MKRLLVLAVVFAAALPAHAHFIWLLPGKDDDQHATMVFSDSLEPDGNVPVTKIAHTKLFARAGKGETVAVKMVQADSFYKVFPEGKGLVLIGGVCRYGVIAKGKGDPFLLMYYPKTVWRKGLVKDKGDWVLRPNAQLPLELLPMAKTPAYKVLWQGKPAAGVDVVLTVPGLEKKVERKTDADGLVELIEPKAGGIYGVLAKLIESKAGTLDGKQYKEIRHYATFTFDFPARFVKQKSK